MAFIPIPQSVRVAMEFTKNGQLVVNVYHVRFPTAIINVNLTAVAQLFVDWWTNDLRSTQNQSLRLERVTVTDWSQPNGSQAVVNAPANSVGTLTGAQAPNNVAIVVSHRTLRTGRSFRGRTYLAGLGASDVADDNISTARAAAIVSAYANLVFRLTTLGGVLVVASFRTNGQPRTVGVVTDISTFVVNTRVDTQRRRLPTEGA